LDVPETGTRLFAAELEGPHRLSFTDESSWEAQFALASDDLYARYGELVEARLAERLSSEPGFLSFRGTWLPESLGVEVHIGHLNIAEAMIDIKGEPLTPEETLVELDFPQEVPQQISVFCLNRALLADDRFDDVGDAQQVRWGLGRWEPESVLSPSPRLVYGPEAYDRTGLDVTHLQLEREIDDETSQLIAPPTAASADAATILLVYPHWRMGTLPLTSRTQAFFPEGSPDQHTRVTFVDRAGDDKPFTGWMLRNQGCVYGLDEWFQTHRVFPGAYVRLERLEDGNGVAIGLVPRRMQREWVFVALERDGELGFQMEKRPIAYEYDELSVFDEEDRAAIDALFQADRESGRPLDELVRSVFLSLVALGPNGMVHSKTIYGAVNVLRRCSPGIVFATLFRLPEFITAGDGYWIYQGSTNAL
jgi:hypothetical protein